MANLRFTLCSEGSSDRALLPLLTWLLQQQGVVVTAAEWADLRNLPQRLPNLAAKIKASLELYPCDLLFVHRDADRAEPSDRKEEIRRAWAQVMSPAPTPAVCVVPVRMLEAWLLCDEAALRRAAGCPFGKMRLDLPRLRQIESLANPKEKLHNLLRQASDLTGRRLSRFNLSRSVQLIATYIEDFALLRELPAFVQLEKDIAQELQANGWR